MKSTWIFLVAVWMLCGCFVVPCHSEEPDPSLDTVLERWEKASQECKILDAKLAFFSYDLLFSKKPEITYGRFYYESPTIGRIDRGTREKKGSWSPDIESIVWNEKEVTRIEYKFNRCVCLSYDDIEKTISNSSQEGFFQEILARYLATLFPPCRPQSQYSLMVDIRAEELRKDYELSYKKHNGDLLLTAIPKKNSQCIYTQIHVILDFKTYQTKAVQYVLSRHHYVSIALYDQKHNEKPADRDQLLKPDLSKLNIDEVAKKQDDKK